MFGNIFLMTRITLLFHVVQLLGLTTSLTLRMSGRPILAPLPTCVLVVPTTMMPQITFAVGDLESELVCPSGYIQNNVNLNDGAGGKIINTCFTYSPSAGAPLTGIVGIQGKF